ncbi:MAG: glycosyltransferase family 39 protein [Chloroflexi bacterium]|nr:glycosyltransferase family 39 protein [Chloroflexota bacterium]
MKTSKTDILHYTSLAAVLLAAFFFRVYDIGAEGYGNMYYASTVFSMLTSWKNFFFSSFDPSGFVSVDKPPFGFWVQAASAAVFGFEGWALMLPQIVSGVLACLVLYWLVRRFFGPNAGLLAALILAVTPIAVAADRNNTIDGQLLLVLLLSAAALTLAVEKGSLKWLVLGAALIGVGFNIKMLQAYMILPAFYGLYFLAARTTWARRILHLAVASLVLIAVSFAWVAAVDLTAEDQRPYVGSSDDNTVTELIVGHNGLSRMGQVAAWFGLQSNQGPDARASAPQQGDGERPPLGQPPSNQGIRPLGGVAGQRPADGNFPAQGQPPQNPNDGNPPGAGDNPQGGRMQNETGTAGLLRLFNQQLAGQVTWLLPLALVLMLALIARQGFSWPLKPETQFALFWGLWLIPMAVFFSYAGLFHRYYLEMLAPAVAALVAGGVTALTRDFAAGRRQGWLLPLSIAGSAIFEAAILFTYWPEFGGWAAVLTLVIGGLVAIGLTWLRFRPNFLRLSARQLVMAGMLGLLVAPLLWSATPLLGRDTALPYAGPELLQRNNIQQPDGGAARQPANETGLQVGKPALLAFLEANDSGETFIVAGIRASEVAPIIIGTGRAAMAIGGFSGSDPILSVEEFAEYVARGEVRFVLSSGSGGPSNRPNGGQGDIMTWVQKSCSVVTGLNLGNANPQNPDNGQVALYDCKP